ncbi:MAG: DNA mismatch repair endonuclease MutL [Kiritimatiellae bacterium]|nr:DNA mismatch repair endonuclease MutL [Kiritimatiellia bacterium]
MPPDGHIRLLPNHVANKIAAGEVVERPASVLKELLENALDAGASRIDVNVTAGGRTLVSVRDNGCGMNREDALLSLERHATSKIRDVDDIERISTLGFRGEAIPSIASVSRFTLTTRRADAEEGTRLVVNAGTLAEVKTCGAPPGTCIEVRDLFCNVPARRKFLRAFVTEEGHIRSTFTVHALAHPDVGFSLTLDGREVYRLPPGATLEERIRALFGAPFAESLVPVTSDVGTVHVHGYAERPGHDAALRRDQFVFVNGRPATAASITYALREAYPRQRAEARPAVVLFIDLPPEQVDVNVHPAKREVRFRRSNEVRDALLAAFAPQRAEREETAPPPTPAPESPAAAPQPFVAPFQPSLPTGGTRFSASARGAAVPAVPAWGAAVPAADAQERAPSALGSSAEFPSEEPPLQTATGPWRWFKFLAQTGSGWVLLETDAGLVTLNPRAARERIAYERIIDAHEALTQPLLIPETVTLPPSESARIRSFLAELQSVGFAVEEFGRDTWKVDAVPALLAGCDMPSLLASIAADIAEAGSARGGARWRDELVARSVARSYSRANLQLTPEAATQLVEELARTRMPYVCPRGRPIMVFTSNAELLRKFDR